MKNKITIKNIIFNILYFLWIGRFYTIKIEFISSSTEKTFHIINGYTFSISKTIKDYEKEYFPYLLNIEIKEVC